jgi:eukaryotic-like serine/threonine-protein kinase
LAAADAVAVGDTERSMAGYRLLRPLGRGGLGEVFEAADPAGSSVAIKAFRLGDDDQGLAAAAFAREAHLAQFLNHPDIVKVLHSGCAGEHAYLVMEFVPGHDLRHHTARDHLLPLGDVLSVAERIARALAAAHALGVVHRDIKPGNVLIDVPTDTVKITDFGVAKLGDVFRSRTGVIAGTPAYMSPEQLAEAAVGPASDLYSLGVMLFELLTGRLPHEASTMGALLAQVAGQTAPRVSSFRADLPVALTTLVADLLNKPVERRPADATWVADQLRAIRQTLASTTPHAMPGPKSRP